MRIFPYQKAKGISVQHKDDASLWFGNRSVQLVSNTTYICTRIHEVFALYKDNVFIFLRNNSVAIFQHLL